MSRCAVLLIIKDQKQHYTWIKHFDRFMFNQTKYEHRKYFCRYLARKKFYSIIYQTVLLLTECKPSKCQKKCSVVKFKNYHKKLPVPFVIYADFEALTQKMDSCQPNDKTSYLEKY